MKRILLFILALILLIPTILLCYGMSLPEYYGESYYAQLPELYEKLKNTEGNKVIIVGGSNVAFGVNSAQMEAILREYGFDYTVCNFGLYAAVGTSAMLELSEDFVKAGDVVILAIEPSSETFSTYFGATAMHKCAESNPEMLLHLNKNQHSNLVGNYLAYLQERAEIQRTGLLPQAEGVYAKASFNENGDMIYDRAGNTMLLGYDTTAPIDLSQIVYEPAFTEQVNAYIASAEQKGAAVLMSFSPMNRGAMVDASEDTVYRFFLELQDKFHCPIISDPNKYIMDSGWFYDSNFHLNNAGTAIRTYTLTCDFLNHMGFCRSIPFEMPKMPDPIAQVEPTGQNSDDFLFETFGENGLVVTGLTEQGKAKQTLMLPSSHNGKPVVGMTATAFAGNTQITELILPATFASIPDGAFAGCINLTKLTLLHTETPPEVGENLFSGADGLFVYVSSGSYHLYRDGAGCTTNSWEPHLGRIITY